MKKSGHLAALARFRGHFDEETPGRVTSIVGIVHLRFDVRHEIVGRVARRETALVSDLGNGGRDMCGDFTDSR